MTGSRSKLAPVLLFVCFACCIFLTFQNASAEVLPQHVAIIANQASKDSLTVARHYLQARQIPETNLISLKLPQEENMARNEYEKLLALPLRQELEKRGLAGKIRLLVTTFGVPLRLGAPEVTGKERQRQLESLAAAEEARRQIRTLLRQISGLGGESNTELPDEEVNKLSDDQQLLQALQLQLRSATSRIETFNDATARRELTQALGSMLEQVSGKAGIVASFRPSDDGQEKRATQMLARWKAELAKISELLSLLEQMPGEKNYRRIYHLTHQAYGWVGVLARAQRDLATFGFKEAGASVDSELSLLWWPEHTYPLSSRVDNPWHLRFTAEQRAQLMRFPVLMVGRLDGPSAVHAIQLVDLALRGEREELKGNVYIDARGREKTAQDLFSVVDQDLRNLGWLLRGETSLAVTIENHETLLKSADKALLYAGWYSHRQFQGEFSFVPGAVGFHIASSEAISLRNPAETGWCKNLIERGITATIGPVDEPYLESFPFPQEFFGLLLTGKYDLGELYFLTLPHLSWQMVLLGDPLYHPWKYRSQLDVGEIVSLSQNGNLKNAPIPPGEALFSNPLELRASWVKKLRELEKELDRLEAQQPGTVPPRKGKKEVAPILG